MTTFPLDRLEGLQTPLYYYDMALLDRTIESCLSSARQLGGARIHYAVKANSQPRILERMARHGLGADCVSGGEIRRALEAGIPPCDIVLAGVGKADWEIRLGLEKGIACFNVESLEELEVISSLALEMGREAPVAFRINPDVGAHTHRNITTGLEENKFGIPMDRMLEAVLTAERLEGVRCIGIHFHIGSQILDMDDFRALGRRVTELNRRLMDEGLRLDNVNLGGGLGVSYEDVEHHQVPDFGAFFSAVAESLRIFEGQQLHFELGRSLVAQAGSLITRCLYVKHTRSRRFAILDAGMTDLIRPALYQARHEIVNLTSGLPQETYDVVGPICESTDVFARDCRMAGTARGDLLAIRSAGAYGQSMASEYNCRPLAPAVFSDSLPD